MPITVTGDSPTGRGTLRTMRTQAAPADLRRKRRRLEPRGSARAAISPGHPQEGAGTLAGAARTWFDTYPERAAKSRLYTILTQPAARNTAAPTLPSGVPRKTPVCKP